MHVCIGMCACVVICTYGSEVDVKGLPQLLSTLFFGTWSLTDLGTCQFVLAGQEDPGLFPSLPPQHWDYWSFAYLPDFRMCAGINLGSHVSMSGMLPREPSL